MMETITLLFIMTDEQDVFNLKSLGVSLEVGIGIDRDVVACPSCLGGCRLFLHLTHLSGNDKSYMKSFQVLGDYVLDIKFSYY